MSTPEQPVPPVPPEQSGAAPQPPQPPERGGRPGPGAKLGWVVAWVLSVALAFVLGLQSRPAQQKVAAPPAAPATNAQDASATSAAKPSQDPRVTQLLKSLPRRDPNDWSAMGRVDAPVVLIEWSDYRCPFCAVWAKQTAPALKKYVDDGTLRIEYRDLSLFGDMSVNTAIAAHAAGRQGRFWQFHDAVYAEAPTSGHPDIGPEKIQQFAQVAGVPDMAKFTADLADPALKKKVDDESQHGQQLGITGTPFFVINTQVMNGAQPTTQFIQAIETAKRGG